MDMAVSINEGPQVKQKYAMILITRLPKRVLNFGTPHMIKGATCASPSSPPRGAAGS